jgi:hypothetical protein
MTQVVESVCAWKERPFITGYHLQYQYESHQQDELDHLISTFIFTFCDMGTRATLVRPDSFWKRNDPELGRVGGFGFSESEGNAAGCPSHCSHSLPAEGRLHLQVKHVQIPLITH